MNIEFGGKDCSSLGEGGVGADGKGETRKRVSDEKT